MARKKTINDSDIKELKPIPLGVDFNPMGMTSRVIATIGETDDTVTGQIMPDEAEEMLKLIASRLAEALDTSTTQLLKDAYEMAKMDERAERSRLGILHRIVKGA